MNEFQTLCKKINDNERKSLFKITLIAILCTIAIDAVFYLLFTTSFFNLTHYLVLGGLLVLQYLHWCLKNYRIKRGLYGNNEMEVREFINDIQTMSDKKNK